jgi:glycosidase
VYRFPVDAYSPGASDDYASWWGFKSLPKFNTDQPALRHYLMEVGRYWIEQGADGWRLDVPNEINDDSFWAEFRHTVKSVNRDAYLVGEIWTADPRWVSPSHFDGLINYPLRDDLLRFLYSTLTTTQFAEKVEGLLQLYPRQHSYAMYLTLGTHDTERLITKLDGDLDRVKLAFLPFFFSWCAGHLLWRRDRHAWEQRPGMPRCLSLGPKPMEPGLARLGERADLDPQASDGHAEGRILPGAGR